jgi:hypothetical protein
VEVRLAHGELTVRDHGAGIDPDDLPFVFDRFYRALSTRAAPGAGLGLAVVQEIALGHGGGVAAEPAHGGGTLMRLTIPTCAPVPDWLADAHGVIAVPPGAVAGESRRPAISRLRKSGADPAARGRVHGCPQQPRAGIPVGRNGPLPRPAGRTGAGGGDGGEGGGQRGDLLRVGVAPDYPQIRRVHGNPGPFRLRVL